MRRVRPQGEDKAHPGRPGGPATSIVSLVRYRAVKGRRRHVGASASPPLTALAVSEARKSTKLAGVDTFVDVAVDVHSRQWRP